MFGHHQIPGSRSENLARLLRFIRFLAELLLYFLRLDLARFFEHVSALALDDVKLVEDDLSLWQELLVDGVVGGIHVAGRGNDPEVTDAHVLEQCFELLLVEAAHGIPTEVVFRGDTRR